MDETRSGMGWAGVLLFIVVIWVIFGGGIGNGWGRGTCNDGGCNRVSNCEVQKQEIVDSARTQYLIETSSRQTQEYLGNKIDFYEYQNLRDQLAAERNKNMALENRIYSDGQFTALSRQLERCCCETDKRFDAIECRMLKRPELSGIAATCSGQIIPPISA